MGPSPEPLKGDGCFFSAAEGPLTELFDVGGESSSFGLLVAGYV
jgi:hypothetical protein